MKKPQEIIISLAEKALGFPVHITRLSAFIELQTQRIGAIGAAEAFANYGRRKSTLAFDSDLNEFMSFYYENWRLSYSQWSQDIFVMFASKQREGGLFLEIGGADGFTHSNTYSLEKSLGWHGVLVEPDPDQVNVLRKARPKSTILELAITPTGTEDSALLRRVGQLSSLDGYEGDDMHKVSRTKRETFASVQTCCLSSLLSQQTYDYLSLDIEGGELQMLSSVNWESINKPRLITVEHNERNKDREEIGNLLISNGYREFLQEHDWLRKGDIWAVLDNS